MLGSTDTRGIPSLGALALGAGRGGRAGRIRIFVLVRGHLRQAAEVVVDRVWIKVFDVVDELHHVNVVAFRIVERDRVRGELEARAARLQWGR